MRIIVGTQGRINELLDGIPDSDFLGISVLNDKAWVVLKGNSKFVEPKELPPAIEIPSPKDMALKKAEDAKAAKKAALEEELARLEA